MSKEQIEEMADDLQDSHVEYFVNTRMWTDYYNTARKLMKKGYRKQTEWISVTKRLPQVTGKYICCLKDKCGNTWTIPADWSLEMKMWFGEFGEIKNMVTHWMPLPEPPDMKGGAE